MVAPTSRQDKRTRAVIERPLALPAPNGRDLLGNSGEQVVRRAQKRATFVALQLMAALFGQTYSANLKVMKLARPWRSTRIDTERFFGSDCATSVKFFAELMAWLFR